MNNIRQCSPACRRVPYVIIIIISMCDSVRHCSTVRQGEWQCAHSARGSVQQCTWSCMYDSACGSVRLCGIVQQCATVCGSACGSVRQCVIVCGSAHGNV